MKVKIDDMIKVLVREILELNQEILFKQQDNMKNMNVLSINSPYKKTTTVHELSNNNKIIKKLLMYIKIIKGK